jgi:hypothetical protein
MRAKYLILFVFFILAMLMLSKGVVGHTWVDNQKTAGKNSKWQTSLMTTTTATDGISKH